MRLKISNDLIIKALCFTVGALFAFLICVGFKLLFDYTTKSKNAIIADEVCFEINQLSKTTDDKACVNAKWLGNVDGIDTVEIYTISGKQHWAYKDFSGGIKKILFIKDVKSDETEY